MSKIHITLVGGQAIPVYQGIMASNPEKIIFIHTSQSQEVVSRLKMIVKDKITEFIRLSPTDPQKIRQCAQDLASKYAQDEVSLNITGGPKSWTYLFGIIFEKQERCTIFYIDQNNDLWDYTDISQKKTDFPDMKTLFILQGTKPPTQYTDFKNYSSQDQKVVNNILELRKINEDIFFALIAKAKKYTNVNEVCVRDCTLRWNKEEKQFEIKLKRGKDVIQKTLKSKHVRNLLLSAGWFEYQVATILARWEHTKTIWTNCVFPSEQTQAKNEIDIIVDTGIKLLFVECKTQIFDNTDIDKFKSATENYGGKGCKTLFVTEALMKDTAKEKCKDNHIPTFSFRNYPKDTVAEHELFKLLNKELFNLNA